MFSQPRSGSISLATGKCKSLTQLMKNIHLKYKQCADAAISKPPIYSTVFDHMHASQTSSGDVLLYARQDYPGCLLLEDYMARLELAESSLAFSSGMAAATSIFMSVPPGKSVIVQNDIYWPLKCWLNEIAPRIGIEVIWSEGLDVEQITKIIRPNTELVWVEILTNPLLNFVDVDAIARLIPDEVVLAVNATCLSPALAKPIANGADIVLHSASKLLGGHSDLMAGMVSTRKNSEFWKRLRQTRWIHGNGLSARDADLLLRSLRTLDIRIIKSSQSAHIFAQALQGSPNVHKVFYPSLAIGDEKLKIDKNILGLGYGPVVGASFHLSPKICKELCANLSLWNNATGYGAVCSSLEHRGTAEYRVSQSPPNFIRFSIGLEPIDQLMSEFFAALENIGMKKAI